MRKVGILDHRICTYCGEDKPGSDFYLIKSKQILESRCKKCANKLKDSRRAEKIKSDPLFAIYRKSVDKNSRDNRNADPERRSKHAENRRKYGIANPKSEERKTKDREYARRRYQEAKSSPLLYAIVKQKANKIAKARRKIDNAYKIAGYLRTSLNGHIAKQGVKKHIRALSGIGCSVNELEKHLQAQFVDGMSWKNYGNKNDSWSIDHVYPMSKWNLNAKAHQLMCNHWTNLRPMWHIENIKKQNKIAWPI